MLLYSLLVNACVGYRQQFEIAQEDIFYKELVFYERTQIPLGVTWTAGSPPTTIPTGSVGVLGDAIYVFGGFFFNAPPNTVGVSNEILRYETSTSSWTSVGQIPWNTYAGQTPPAGVYDQWNGHVEYIAAFDSFFLVGGRKFFDGWTNWVAKYHVGTNSWTQLNSHPDGGSGLGIADPAIFRSGNNLKMITGSMCCYSVLAKQYDYNPTLDSWTQYGSQTFSWQSQPTIPPFIVTSGANVYLVGDRIELYNSGSNSATLLGSLPDTRTNFFYAGFGNRIFIMGGILSGSLTATTWIFETATGLWTQGPALPVPLAQYGGRQAVTVGNTIYILGGSTSVAMNSFTKAVYAVDLQ